MGHAVEHALLFHEFVQSEQEASAEIPATRNCSL